MLGRLGKGGMGEVYRAYDVELHGEVALKIVRGDAEGDEALARKITSPNVLRVYDLAEHAGLRFLTMEYVDSEDLLALMRREGRMPLPRALALFRQICVGLEAAHAQGVVHRDLKPDNVLVDRNDRVRVADFGLARTLGDSSLTVQGEVLGSPAYMSPEQVKGDPVDERSDVYSLGIMLYQLVTGTTPFRADTPHAVMEMRLHKVPRPLRELCADTPDYLEGIVARCLLVDPAGRYASVHELVADLDATLARPHGHAPLPAVAPAARPAVVEPTSSGPITLARAQEGLGSSDATSSYREFLAMLPDADRGIAIVDDARRRAR